MKNSVYSILLLFLLSGCITPSKEPQRYAWITGLKPDMAARYEYLHAHPWPSVSKTLKECHIQNFSIHEREIEGKLYLFAYLEYTGKDFEADMKKMAADPETQRWWKETDPCQFPSARCGCKRKNLGRYEGCLFSQIAQAKGIYKAFWFIP